MRWPRALGLLFLSVLLVVGNLYAATCPLACALSTRPSAADRTAALHHASSANKKTAPAARLSRSDDDCTATPLRAVLDRPAILLTHSPAASFVSALPATAPSPVWPEYQSISADLVLLLPCPARGVPLRI